MIRENDVKKAQQIFTVFHPEFTEQDFICAEGIASGIEYAMLMASDEISLDKRIHVAIDSILKLYDVPKELREEKLRKIHNFDYCGVAQTLLQNFMDYVDEVNSQAVQSFVEHSCRCTQR